MKRGLVISAGIVLVVMVIGIGYFYMKKGEAEATQAPKSKLTKSEEAKVKTEISNSFYSIKGKIPDYQNMSENELMQEVHVMTHQKVAAEEKWGSSEITKAKVDQLYNVIKNKQFTDHDLQTMLLSILQPWKKGDFSNAVKAHNEIWKYQHGDVGKATRLLTAEEEKKYIDQHFNQNKSNG